MCVVCGQLSTGATQYVALGMFFAVSLVAWYFLSWKPYFAPETPPSEEDAEGGTCCGSRRLQQRVLPWKKKATEKGTLLVEKYMDLNIKAYLKIFIR